MKHQKCRFLEIPNELILLVTTHLEFEIDFNSLCRTNRKLHALLNPVLYKRCVSRQNGDCTLNWAAERGLASTSLLLKEAGGLPNESISDNEYWWTFALAAAYGRLEMIQQLYDYGVNPCLTDEEWRNLDFNTDKWCNNSAHDKYRVKDTHPLCLAVDYGDISVVKQLLEYGVQPALCLDADGRPSALCSAAGLHHSDSFDLVRLLVDAGSPINTYGKNRGKTALAHAAEGGDLEMVQFLLSRGADPNLAFRFKDTPLFAACCSDNVDIVRCLLDNGAVIDLKCENGRGSHLQLFRAAKGGYHEIVDLLLAQFNYIELSQKPHHKTNLLCVAAMTGRTALLTDLLTKYKYNNNFRVERVTALRRKGFGTNSLDALTCATEHNQITAMETLLSHGAPTIPLGRIGWRGGLPIFSYAIENNSIEAIETLLAHGVDVNDPPGKTLECAIEKPPIFSLLLSRGANPVASGQDRSGLFASSLRSGVVDTVKILLDLPGGKELFIDPLETSASLEYPYPVFEAAFIGGKEMLHLLLDRGLVTIPERFGRTMIHRHLSYLELKKRNELAPLRFFLELNHDELAANHAFDLAYHVVILCNDSGKFLDLLQEYGFDINPKNENGDPLLIQAMIAAKEDAFQGLLEREADPLAVCNGKTALSLVVKKGYFENFKAILRFLDTHEPDFDDIEEHIKSAQKIALEEGHMMIYRELCRLYWRKRYPC